MSRYAILGAGAMGSVFGGFLDRAGHEVTLLDVDDAHMSAVAAGGLAVEHPDGSGWTARPRASSDTAAVSATDAVIVLAKGHAARAAGTSIRHLATENVLVVTLMNGLGHDRVLAEVLPDAQVLPGTTTVGAELLAPGRVRMTAITASGGAVTYVGPPRAGAVDADLVERFTEDLTAAGLRTVFSADADRLIWTKLAMAAAMAPLTAVVGATVRDVWRDRAGRELVRAIFEEIVAVAAADGIALDGEAVWQHCVEVWDTDQGFLTSMAMDVQRNRPTEIDSFSVEIAARAAAHGMSAPYCALLGSIIGLTTRIHAN